MRENINNLNALILKSGLSAEEKQEMLDELIAIEQKRRQIERLIVSFQERNQ